MAVVAQGFDLFGHAVTLVGDDPLEHRDTIVHGHQIAAQGGRRIKELRAARMGVVQINPLYGTETSWEGNNDTTSLEKTITSTVSATFSLR